MLAIDAKTLRRSFDRAASTSALHVVSAFASDRRLVLGQAAVGESGKEITAARDLLALLDLDGLLVTGDALHRQTETAQLIAGKGGDWLFALKANRPALHAAVSAFFADPESDLSPTHTTTDADHGRIEVRRHRVAHDVDWLFSDRRFKDEPRLPGLQTIAMVDAEIERDGKKKPAGAFTSLPPASPQKPSPAPCVPTGRSKTAFTGCWTWLLTRTAPEPEKTMAPKISPSCENSP